MQRYAETTHEGVRFIVFAERDGRIYARTTGVGGVGFTVEDALIDAMARYEAAGRPEFRGFITPPHWRSVSLKDIRRPVWRP